MGIDPRIFGPSFWGALHLACLGAENPDKVREFIALYPYVLPCIGCRNHFAQVLIDNPIPDTDDKMELFDWSVLVHNIVNVRIGKPTFTSDEALIYWVGNKLMEFENDARPKTNYWPAVIAVSVLIILIFLFLKFKKV